MAELSSGAGKSKGVKESYDNVYDTVSKLNLTPFLYVRSACGSTLGLEVRMPELPQLEGNVVRVGA